MINANWFKIKVHHQVMILDISVMSLCFFVTSQSGIVFCPPHLNKIDFLPRPQQRKSPGIPNQACGIEDLNLS